MSRGQKREKFNPGPTADSEVQKVLKERNHYIQEAPQIMEYPFPKDEGEVSTLAAASLTVTNSCI